MPICYITVSDKIQTLEQEELNKIKVIISEELISYARFLDSTHIVLRIQQGNIKNMLGEIELDIFANFDFQRYWSRDKRSRNISYNISKLLNYNCATWINLNLMGYARVTTKGKEYFSD